VTKKMVNITMYGDGSQKTIVTGNKNFADGVQTFRTATFGILMIPLTLCPSQLLSVILCGLAYNLNSS
jgi:hypothetical protein